MRDILESIFGYIFIMFLYLLACLVGFERIKKVGYCILKKFEDKPCETCEKTNVFREISKS